MKLQCLLARHGFKREEKPFSHAGALLNAAMQYLQGRLAAPEEVDEALWMEALEHAAARVPCLGREGLVNPLTEELPLASIDPYMRGIVRWMNELGIHTRCCCDGHGEKAPMAALLQLPSEKQIRMLAFCLPEGLRMRRMRTTIYFEAEEKSSTFELLLDFAERLHNLAENPTPFIRREAELFKETYLTDLLSIPGVSGREGWVRSYLKRKLRMAADHVYTDACGNLLAVRHCGDGPTVLLSAHMDVYEELDPRREIVEEDVILRSTCGILGADDRAGIAVVLRLFRGIAGTNFRGTLKLAFTVGEETGLIGSTNMDEKFLAGVHAAIVADRRGKRDVVVCRGEEPFCDPSYGKLFEEAGALAGMKGWKRVSGGSSDALVFARKFGINTVNLSVGYENEHTWEETLDYIAAYETSMLIETVLDRQLIGKWAGFC